MISSMACHRTVNSHFGMSLLTPRWLLLVAVALSGCAAAPQTCLLPSQKPMVLIDLYFGRDIPGRAPLTEAEWAGFARAQLTPRFPDGFTVIDAQGQWLDPATRIIGAEASKMVRIAAVPSADLATRITTLTGTYRQKFHQTSVGITTAPACAAF